MGAGTRYPRRRKVGAFAARLAVCVGFLFVFGAVLAPPPTWASRYTPAEWRRLIPDARGHSFAGQRKHVGWSRDRDSNFVDDRIPAGLDTVRVVLELNDCYPPDYLIHRFGRFGRIDHVGQLVSCIYLSRVRTAVLDSLARQSEVAMVVWAPPLRPSMGVSVAAVQAAPSSAYGTEFVRTNSGGKWVDPLGGTAMTGAGVNIAIVDTGVRNAHSTLPGDGATSAGPIVAGYDATTSSDPSEPGSDPDAWGPLVAHGSRVASIALGRGKAGVDCGKDTSEPSAPDCAGIAPEAGLVDVKVIAAKVGSRDPEELFAEGSDFMRGLEWITLHKIEYGITVVNISLSDGIDCDGTCPACEAVNVLASVGVTPVVGLGNRNDDDTDTAIRRVPTPAAASSAITVGGSDDLRSVGRSGDSTFDGHLIGPRWVDGAPDTDPVGEKPDFVAPSRNIVALGLPSSPFASMDADAYTTDSGTSYAAPLAAGAAALLIQANPALVPAGVKDLLRRTADHSIVTSGASAWDDTFGMGSLNVYAALKLARQTDLRFASCDGVASAAGLPCPLADLPSWLNTKDLTVDPDPPQNGVPCTIKAKITNDGDVDATSFLVSFGYYEFGTGSTLFHEIDSKLVDRLSAHATTEVACEWTPSIEGHQCLQATIAYGPDLEVGNNTTQRNITVEASTYDVRIDNPYLVPARFYVHTKSNNQNWTCVVDQPEFTIGGPEDCAVHVRVGFSAPNEARIGEHAACDVSVYSKPAGARDSTLIGGVTVVSEVPDTCRISGRLVGIDRRPIEGVTLIFERDAPPVLLRAAWEQNRETTTSSSGTFDLQLPARAHKRLRIRAPGYPEWVIPFEFRCGAGSLQIEVARDGARLIR